MTFNLAKNSLAELHRLATDVELELQRRNQRKISDARAQVYAIARNLGMDVRELLGRHSKDNPEQKKSPVKYRNPKNARQEWTGRGRRPQWVTQSLAEGKALADLVVG